MPTRSRMPLAPLAWGLLVRPGAAQAELYRVDGPSPGSKFGSAVAAVGDVDQDGVRDFVVGAPEAGGGAGRASLHSGADGRLVHEWLGGGAGEALGSAVAGAGDVDGDGIEDVLVGAVGVTDPGTGRQTGAVSLFRGADGGLLRIWYGGYDGEKFGSAIANVGDVDFDGIDDVLIGAPLSDYVQTDGGAAYLYSGKSGKALGRLDGPGAANELGAGLAALGDVDHDGAGDFAVGLPLRNAGGLRDSGAIYVYSGATRRRLFSILGDQVDLHLGSRMAGGFDLDGDGAPDLLSGEPTRTGTLSRQGALRAYSGADGALLWERLGARADEHLGAAVAIADSDGDERPELFVGAGQVGVADDRVERLSPFRPTLWYAWPFAAADDGLGEALAILGDVNGDGVVDVAFGAPRADDGNATRSGAVSVRAGSDLWLNADPKEAGAGDTLVTTIREGEPGYPTIRFVVDVSGTRLFLGLVPVVPFDGFGSASFSDDVPPGLSGLTVTLRAYAITPALVLIDSNDELIEFL